MYYNNEDTQENSMHPQEKTKCKDEYFHRSSLEEARREKSKFLSYRNLLRAMIAYRFSPRVQRELARSKNAEIYEVT